jgi:GT2 family glycosyltransferase
MRISCVILSFNSARFIDKCVRSLATALHKTDEQDEAWVVENGSRDGSADMLRALEKEFPWLHVLYMDHNTGTTVSRNKALRAATGRYLLVLDSDAYVPEGTVEPLLARLDRDRDCGLVVPRLMYPSGNLQLSTDVFPTVVRKAERFLALKKLEARQNNAAWPTEPSIVDYAISAFWLFRRDVLENVGYLDENIFYSPEDVDYCLRIWEAGYKIVYDPSVHAVHDAQEISRGFPLKLITLSHAKGLGYLFWKHRYALGHGALYKRLKRHEHTL